MACPKIELFGTLGNPKNLQSRITQTRDQRSDPTKALTEAIRALAVQTYLLLESRPDMVSESPYVPQTRQEARQCKLNPVEAVKYLGRGFAIAKASSNGSEVGSGKSSHWRRGHWRNQPYGSKNTPQFKPLWIPPVFVTGTRSRELVALVTA